MTDCSRCGGAMVDMVVPEDGGGAYRGAQIRAQRCTQCAVAWVDTTRIAPRALVGTMLERKREPAAKPCPRCGGRVAKLTLSWDTYWVQIEECAPCRIVAVDPGEYPELRMLLGAAHDVLVSGA